MRRLKCREAVMNDIDNSQTKPQSLTFFQMVGSVMASFFGVQSAEKRERDFTHGRAKHFIAVGILMTFVWYGSIALLVHFVLNR
jgi:hypothetical protein